MTSPLLSLMLMVYLRSVLSNEGDMHRTMNIKDGYAMKAAVDSGYNVCIISGGSNEGVRVRLHLGITDIHLGSANKVETLTNIPMCTTLSQNKYCIWRRYPGL
jgi:3-deoxy-D-manno-octulosonate 8-phosphate phosphatase KdsC-like HAD superfamily phosphatase